MTRLLHSGLALISLGAVLAATSQKGPVLKFRNLEPGRYGAHAAAVPYSVPRYDLVRNRLIFTQKNVRVAVAAMGDYLDRIFEIDGLANPEIQVVRGARLTFDVVNLSRTLPAYFIVSPAAPPYPLPEGVWTPPWPWSRWISGTGRLRTRALPGWIGKGAISDAVLTYDAVEAGVAYYMAQPPFNRGGEYGRIIVVP